MVARIPPFSSLLLRFSSLLVGKLAVAVAAVTGSVAITVTGAY